jgi:sulfatase modifying factor 1
MRMLAHIALVVCCCVLAAAGGQSSSSMVAIEGGIYQRPLEKGGQTRTVDDYQLDVRQVTNAEFLEFVMEHPEWRRSKVNPLFADKRYLVKWSGDTALGPGAPPDAPVTCVSWFAARAFLKSVGKRLPTVDEWEFAARADANSTDSSKDPGFKARILDWYSRPEPPVLPAAASLPADIRGVRGMHGAVWEWTSNFISAMTSGEARSDGTLAAQQFCGGGGADPNQATEYANFMRMAFRSSLKGDFCLPGLGFRGAKDAGPPATTTNTP